MVKVPSSMFRSKEPFVEVTILGVADVQQMLMRQGIMLTAGVESQILRSAQYAASEVQESIIGNRDEIKSVDTGRFANSIQVQIEGAHAIISSPVEYAVALEYGTTKMPTPRKHFRNTAVRIEPVIKEQFEKVVKKVVGNKGLLSPNIDLELV